MVRHLVVAGRNKAQFPEKKKRKKERNSRGPHLGIHLMLYKCLQICLALNVAERWASSSSSSLRSSFWMLGFRMALSHHHPCGLANSSSSFGSRFGFGASSLNGLS